MRNRLLTALIAFVFGVLGVGLALLAQVAYQDHKTLQVLVQIEAQRQQAAKPPAAPAQ
jgi:hypothetical protein